MPQVCRPTPPSNSDRVWWVGAAMMAAAWFGIAGNAVAAAWYVDGLSGKSSNNGMLGQPFLFVWQATQAAAPGDVIYLLPTSVYPHQVIHVSGSPGHPITVTGAGVAPNLTQVVGDLSHFAIQVSGNYITISNLDLSAPGTRAGLQIPAGFHHAVITGNIIHDSGGNGISTSGADYVKITHNVIYGNARNTSNGVFGSGISMLHSVDTDTNTAVKMVIFDNVIYGNTNTPNCGGQAACLASATDENGSGIIIDDGRHTETDQLRYRGATLIANNLVFGNVGRGIYVFQSDHVTITGNTVYGNNQDPYEGSYRPGEVMASYGGDIEVVNNVLVSDGGMGINGGVNTGTHVALSFEYCQDNTGPLVAQNNLAFDTPNDRVMYFGKQNTIPLVMSANVWGDPGFVAASDDPRLADFRLTAGSPGLGVGNLATSVAVDLLGTARTVPVTVGAYQAIGP